MGFYRTTLAANRSVEGPLGTRLNPIGSVIAAPRRVRARFSQHREEPSETDNPALWTVSKSPATWPHRQLRPHVETTEHYLAPTQYFHRSRNAPGSSQEQPPVHVPITPLGLGESQIPSAERHYTGGQVRTAPLRPDTLVVTQVMDSI